MSQRFIVSTSPDVIKLEAMLTGLLSYHFNMPKENVLIFLDFISYEVPRPIFAIILSAKRGGLAKRFVLIVPAA